MNPRIEPRSIDIENKFIIESPALKSDINLGEDIDENSAENQFKNSNKKDFIDNIYNNNEILDIIKFDFDNDNTLITMFQKNGWLWIGFNYKPKFISLSEKSNAWQNYHVITNQESDDYFVIRLKTDGVPVIEHKINSYSLNFTTTNSNKEIVNNAINPSFINQELLFKSNNFGGDFLVHDPDTQQKINIIFSDGFISTKHKYVFYDLIESICGIALIQKHKDVKINYKDKSIRIIGPKLYKDFTNLRNFNTDLPILNLKRFKVDLKAENFTDKKNNLMQEIYQIKEEKLRKEARLNMIKFYLANKMSKEAYDYIKHAKSKNPRLSNDFSIELLESITLFMSGLYKDSLSKLEKLIKLDSLNELQRQEVDFWIDSATILSGKTLDKFNLDTILIPYYTNQKDFLLAALINAVSHEDVDKTAELQRLIDFQNYDKTQKYPFMLAEADFFKKKHFYAKAHEIYDKIISDINNPKYRALAQYEKLSLLYERKEIELEEFLKKIEQLSYIWRDGKFELKLINEIIDHYLEKNKYYESLKFLKIIHTYLGAHTNIFSVQHQMSNLFKKIFTTEIIKNLDSFDVLKIFTEFHSLAPLGEEGTLAVINYINAMQDLNLLEKASFAIEHLLKYKLKDERREEFLTRLIKMYIENKQYNEAIDTISFFNTDYSEELRKYESYAHVKLGNYDKAIEIIKDDKSYEADAIISDIHWYSKNWVDLIKLGESKLIYREYPDKPLNSLEHQLVFRNAVAYIMQNDRSTLIKLYEAFQDMMSKNLVQDKAFYLFDKIVKVYDEKNYIAKIDILFNAYTQSVLDKNFYSNIEMISIE